MSWPVGKKCQQYGHSCLGGHGKRSQTPIGGLIGAITSQYNSRIIPTRSLPVSVPLFIMRTNKATSDGDYDDDPSNMHTVDSKLNVRNSDELLEDMIGEYLYQKQQQQQQQVEFGEQQYPSLQTPPLTTPQQMAEKFNIRKFLRAAI